MLQPPAELLVFLLPRPSPHWGASPLFKGGGINKHNSRKPHVCNNTLEKSPWLSLPALGCSSAKPTSPPKHILTSVSSPGSCPGHSSHLSRPCRGRGARGALSCWGLQQDPPHIAGGAAPRRAASPRSCLGQGQQLPADTENAQASELWRMSTYCEKPHSLLFPHLPSSLVRKWARFTGIANEGRVERTRAPLLSRGQQAEPGCMPPTSCRAGAGDEGQ